MLHSLRNTHATVHACMYYDWDGRIDSLHQVLRGVEVAPLLVLRIRAILRTARCVFIQYYSIPAYFGWH